MLLCIYESPGLAGEGRANRAALGWWSGRRATRLLLLLLLLLVCLATKCLSNEAQLLVCRLQSCLRGRLNRPLLAAASVAGPDIHGFGPWWE